MHRKYSFAEICFEINIPFELDEKYFSIFKCKMMPDIKFEVEEKNNIDYRNRRIIYSDENRKIYLLDNGTEMTEYRGGDEKNNYILYNFKNYNKSLYIPKETREGYTMMGQLIQSLGIENTLLNFGAVIFHSNFIIYNGEAILFTGLSGSGKSTQGFLWQEYQNAEVINGDRSLLKFKDGKLFAYGIPYCGSSEICENKSAPVKAVVLVNKDSFNSVENIPFKESFKIILSQIAVDRWKAEDLNKAMDVTERIVSSVPVLKLNCLKNKESTTALKNYLFKGDD